MEESSEKELKKLRELIKKQDKSARILILPNQFFFGNHVMPIFSDLPIRIGQSVKNKLTMFMTVNGDPKLGYKQTSLAIALSQIAQIRLVEEENNGVGPPAIIVTLKEDGAQQVFQRFPGLKERVDASVSGNECYGRDMMFLLKVFQGQQRSAHIKYEYVDNGQSISRLIEFDEAKSIFTTEIDAVHKQYLLERVIEKKGSPTTESQPFFKEVDHKSFTTILTQRGIERDPNCRGSFRRIMNFRMKKPVPVNCEEYSKGQAVGISVGKPDQQYVQECIKLEKVFRKRKMDGNLAKNLRWRNREGWVSPCVQDADKNQVGLHSEGADEGTGMYLYMGQANCENEGVLFKKKIFEDGMECNDPILQNNNGFNHQTATYPSGNDITAVTEGMSHIDMSSIIPGWHIGAAHYGDPNNRQQYYDPEALIYDLSAEFNQNTLSQGDNVFSSSFAQRESSSSPPTQAKQRCIVASGEEKVCVFPVTRLAIFAKDVRTLDRKEFVNDIVMEFMASYIHHYRISEQLRAKVHTFSTFFYTNISKELPSLCFSQRRPINPEHERLLKFDSILRWTKKFDLFKKEYLVIPLNEDLHWMLIVLINPGGAIVDLTSEKKSRNAPKAYMLFFDPLSGLDPSRRNHMSHCVKLWLRAAYQEYNLPGKKFAYPKTMIFDESRIEVIRPKNVPVQNNFYDCGLYVLHYIEGIFCSPAGPIVLKDVPELDWAERWPEAEKMCDLMRDKVYNLIVHFCDEEGRSRLAQYERVARVGLSREKELRKSRRHSAAQFRRTRRHPDYHARHYSANPPSKDIMTGTSIFANPRDLALMPLTQRVRSLRIPEENFPMAY